MAQVSNSQPSILNVHTPTSSFSIIHSLNQEDLTTLFEKLSRKVRADYQDEQVGPGWLKYDHSDTIWNLDDESDYAIFSWRQQQYRFNSPASNTSGADSVPSIAIGEPGPSRLPVALDTQASPTPTLYLHNPSQPLPIPPAYTNPSYYAFHPARTVKSSPGPSSAGRSSRQSDRRKGIKEEEKDGVPKLMKQFEKFHNENGVRTVMGSIGPVKNVRMLLKVGHRHVYISRKFAQKHGFIPRDAAPGNYGYGGLVNIGTWPITLMTSTSSPNARGEVTSLSQDQLSGSDVLFSEGESLLRPPSRAGAIGLGIGRIGTTHSEGRKSPALSYQSASSRARNTIARSSSRSSKGTNLSPLLSGANEVNGKHTKQDYQRHGLHADQKNSDGSGPTVTNIQVYLCEEPHFDVVLGRSFFEKRQIKTSSANPTDVVCLDTGEKIECELVILKDGKGEIVTVT